jgi:hypothetical protein
MQGEEITQCYSHNAVVSRELGAAIVWDPGTRKPPSRRSNPNELPSSTVMPPEIHFKPMTFTVPAHLTLFADQSDDDHGKADAASNP